MTVLSFAFTISPAFVILRGLFFYSIFLQHLPASLREDPQAFVWLCFGLTVVTARFLTLAWITFTAGRDLWRRKDGGRKLAYISTIPFVPLGIGFLLSSDLVYNMLRAAFCA